MRVSNRFDAVFYTTQPVRPQCVRFCKIGHPNISRITHDRFSRIRHTEHFFRNLDVRFGRIGHMCTSRMMSTTIDGRSPVVDAAEIDAIHTGHTHEDAQHQRVVSPGTSVMGISTFGSNGLGMFLREALAAATSSLAIACTIWSAADCAIARNPARPRSASCQPNQSNTYHRRQRSAARQEWKFRGSTLRARRTTRQYRN